MKTQEKLLDVLTEVAGLKEGDIYCAWIYKGKVWHKKAETKSDIAKEDAELLFKALTKGGIERMSQEGYLRERKKNA